QALDARDFYFLPNLEMAIERAIEIFRRLQDRDEEAQLYYMIASYYLAEDFYRLGLSVASQGSSDRVKVRSLEGLALMEFRRGNYSRALQLAQEINRISRASGNIRGELSGIRLQALCYSFLGYLNCSMQFLDEGKELVVRASLQGGEMEELLKNIESNVYQAKTEYSNARRIHEAILCQTSAVLSPVSHAYALVNIAFSTLAMYMQLFAAARGRDREIAHHCLMRLADPINPVHTNTECARWAVLFLAFVLRPRGRSLLMINQALRCLGDVFFRQDTEDMALSILEVALDGFTKMDVHQSRAECMRTIGDIYAAQPLFERSEQKKEVARIVEKLQALDMV
ncbi:hypothetical protein B0H14DRAFT_2731931, partial [Mycena olivaceomarginata]